MFCAAFRQRNETFRKKDKKALGPIKHVIGRTPNSWNKYIIHAIEPILANLEPQGPVTHFKKNKCKIQYQSRLLLGVRRYVQPPIIREEKRSHRVGVYWNSIEQKMRIF